ncbi:MAG TPA: choice-of-anchor tandem repeat GloVer-containing protein [Rhizomicrobium sp.]|nr:choice-of-anchor tandem repeat GloVer-containing protein [Rhizomicrobium sp.]
MKRASFGGTSAVERIVPGVLACALLFLFACGSYPAEAATERVVYSFCSQNFCADGTGGGLAGLIAAGGKLYGTTPFGGTHRKCYDEGCGTVFALDPQTGAFTTLYSFCRLRDCADGSYPESTLLLFKGRLYGTTSEGGSTNCYYGCGIVFSIDPTTGIETVVYSFRGGSDGEYGSALIHVSGTLYGTTALGGGTGCGGAGCGTVFALSPDTGSEGILHAFQDNGTDGYEPRAALLDVDGTLYGTTEYGGVNQGGTVFSVDTSTGAEAIIHAFADSDGNLPLASLVRQNHYLYGTTEEGGAYYNNGTVFSIHLDDGTEKVVRSFYHHRGGDNPLSPLIVSRGRLYGTTPGGGDPKCGQLNYGCGVVFSINPSTGTENVIYDFGSHAEDGLFPYAGLTEMDGTFYGTTQQGGTYGYGAVFAVTP